MKKNIWIGKFIVVGILCITQVGYAQKKVKKDIYLFFTPEAPNYKYSTPQSTGPIRGKIYPVEIDVYGTIYPSADGLKKIRNSYFMTINKNRYRVTDSVEFKSLNAIPYQNLPSIKGIERESSDARFFPYKNVYVIEKMGGNQFKIVQVRTYIGSNQVTYSTGRNM